MTRLARLLRALARPAHIGWGGDLREPFAALWEPDPRGQVR